MAWENITEKLMTDPNDKSAFAEKGWFAGNMPLHLYVWNENRQEHTKGYLSRGYNQRVLTAARTPACCLISFITFKQNIFYFRVLKDLSFDFFKKRE